MAQEQDKKAALDKKTKKLSGGRIESGKEFPAYQEAQQQLLAIQAEQQQNLALTRAESKASFDNNQTLAQAAELGAISAAEAEQAAQAGGQVNLNPATQQILSKYGAGQPHFSRSQSHSQQTTKQNIIINNNITSNTTNDVKIPANVGGPIQGRPIQMKDPGQSSTNKFKVWISQAFARQNEEWNKRDREYRNRESSLTKSANRMMKKLGEIGETIGSRMDPRKIGSTWQSQLKTLLLLFGFGYLSSNWTNILDTVSGIETWVKKTWDYFAGNDKDKSFANDIKYFLGSENGDSIPQAIGNLLGEEGLWGRIKDYFEKLRKERVDSIKLIKTPEFELSDLNNPIDGLKKIIEYLGNVIKVAFGGAEAAKGVIKSQIRGEADKASRENIEKSTSAVEEDFVFKDPKTGNKISADKGIGGIMAKESENTYVGITHHTLNGEGEIDRSFGAEGGYAVSNDILRLNKEAKEGSIKPIEVARDFERLYNAAKLEENEGNKGIAISRNLAKRYLSEEDQKNLTEAGKLNNTEYYKVLRRKDKRDNKLEGTDAEEAFVKTFANKAVADALGFGNFTPESIGNLTNGAIVGTATGGFALGPNGAFLGGLLGLGAGAVLNIKEVKAAIAALKAKAKKELANHYRVEYVRELREGDIPIIDKDGKPEKIKLLEANSDVIQMMANKAAGSTKDIEIDSTDKDFLNSIESNFKNTVNSKATVIKSKTSSESLNKLDKIEEETEKRDKEYNEKHENDYISKAYRRSKTAVSGPIKSKEEFVQRIRPILKEVLSSKEYVPEDKVEEFADVLTSQSGLESGWGTSELSKSYNNYSGMTVGTAPNKSGSIEMTNKSGNDKNTYATFNTIEDWANDYVEYLNRKFKAFSVEPKNYYSRIQHNETKQSYATDPDYEKKGLDSLETVRKVKESIPKEESYNENEFEERLNSSKTSTTTTSSSNSNGGGSGFLGKVGSFISSSRGRISGLFGGFLNSLADLFGMSEENKQLAEKNAALSESSSTEPTITTTNEVSSEIEPNYTTNSLDYSTLSGDGYNRINDSGIFLQDKPIMDIVDVTPPELPEEPVGAFSRFQMKGKEENLTYYLKDISSRLDAIFNVSSINANATANVVDAVNQGTRVQANSSQNTARMVEAQSQNRIEPTPSLDRIESNLDNI